MKTVIIHHRRLTDPHDDWKLSFQADDVERSVQATERDEFGFVYTVDITDDADELRYMLWSGDEGKYITDPPGRMWQSVPLVAATTEFYYIQGDVSNGEIQPLPITQLEQRAYGRLIEQFGSVSERLIELREATSISMGQLADRIDASVSGAGATVDQALTAVEQALDGQARALRGVLSVQPPLVDEQATRDLATRVLTPAGDLAAVLRQIAKKFQAESGAPIPQQRDYLPVQGQEPQQPPTSAVLAGLIELAGMATSLLDRCYALKTKPAGVDAAYLYTELIAAINSLGQSVDDLVKSVRELFPEPIPPAVRNLLDAIRDELRPAVDQVTSAIWV